MSGPIAFLLKACVGRTPPGRPPRQPAGLWAFGFDPPRPRVEIAGRCGPPPSGRACRVGAQRLAPPVRVGEMGLSFASGSVWWLNCLVRPAGDCSRPGYADASLSLSRTGGAQMSRAADIPEVGYHGQVTMRFPIGGPPPGHPITFLRGHSPRLVPYLGTTLFVALASVSCRGTRKSQPLLAFNTVKPFSWLNKSRTWTPLLCR